MDYKAALKDWMEHADKATVQELSALQDAELEERFYTELQFGTAGLRGLMGAGTNRMNSYVVRRTTKGLADYLNGIDGAPRRGVVIAYDSRRLSDVFAREAALVLAENGIHTYLFESLRAVPQLSFAVRYLGCMAGIVITASHNPAAYNGYKVYWEDGGQLGPAQAEAVLDKCRHTGYFETQAMDYKAAVGDGFLTIIGKEVDEAYYAATETLLSNPALLREHGGDLNIVYTPLHGAGNIPVRTLLKRVGVTNVHVVEEQAEPDGAFPTVTAPNPENPEAYALAEKLAARVNADTILATDPDSDRLGVAVRMAGGEFTVLTGNQIGCLLLEYILSTLHDQGRIPENALVVKSIVSTRLADAICAYYSVQLDAVLTGFRFISQKIEEGEKTGDHTFLFGFEESYGYLVGSFSRDKDAIGAAMILAEACTVYAAKGMTLYGALEALYRKYGYYKEGAQSYTLEGKAGMEKIAHAMQELRAGVHAPFPAKLRYVEDYQARKRTDVHLDEQWPLLLPASDVLRLLFEDDTWIAVRPSGTEPKLKLYVGTNARDEKTADETLGAYMRIGDTLLKGLLGTDD